MRILSCPVSAKADGRPVGAFVRSAFHLGTHAFRRLKMQNGILVNGQSVHARHTVHEGDTVSLLLEDIPAAKPFASSLIVYMDDDLIICNKPAPMPTLPGSHPDRITLRDAVASELGLAHDFAYHPVNRLDKGTSGLLCLARHAHAQNLLTQSLHSPSFCREYLAITDHIPAFSSGVIDAPIAHTGPGTKRSVSAEGKPSRTFYRLEAVHGCRALLRLRLETGRTHQIRVHLAHIGCPIAGDYLYGTELSALPGRFALHSCALTLTQPLTGQPLHFEAPLPLELRTLFQAE